MQDKQAKLIVDAIDRLIDAKIWLQQQEGSRNDKLEAKEGARYDLFLALCESNSLSSNT